MNALYRAVDAVEWVLDRFMVVLFLVMVVSIVWQVFARYVLQQPTVWSEELARFLMVWVTMLGSALVMRHEGHVAVTLFFDMLPARVQVFVGFVRDAAILAMMGVLAWYGYSLAMLGGRQTSSGLGLTMTYPYLSIPVGAVLIALFLVFRRTRA